jgi:hypothetical protein
VWRDETGLPRLAPFYSHPPALGKPAASAVSAQRGKPRVHALRGEWRKRSRIVMTAGAVRGVQTPAPNQWSACLSLVQGAACDHRQTI